MSRGAVRSVLLLLYGLLAVASGGVQAQTDAPMVAESQTLQMGAGVEDLGGGRYRIGAIEVDKNGRRFEVTGTVLPVDTEAMPIEFLGVTRGGLKAYEAVIELESSAIEFNMACILIGLDAARATHPQHHFDPAPLEGDRVTLEVSWDRQGERVTHPLADLIFDQGKPVLGDWVYTGSVFSSDGIYMAEEFGTLIGVVHDPDSIIQHRTGLGLGDYGAVTINPAVMPAAGTPMTITVAAGAGR